MSEIEKLGIGLGANLAGLKKDFADASGLVDRWAKDLEAKSAKIKIKAPEAGAGAGASGGKEASPAEGIEGSLLPLAAKIKGSITAATAPLASFGSRFEASFQRVGATIIELARRIDSEMKFPKVQATFDKVRAKAKATFVDAEGAATKFGQRLDTVLSKTQGIHKLADSFGAFGSVVKKSIDGIKPDKINFDKPVKSMKGLAGAADHAKTSFKALGAEILIALGAFGLAFKAVSFISDGVKGASDLNETLSKTDAILGGASAGVKTFADDMASRFGLVKQETLDIASGIGGLGKGLGGLSGKGLEDFTVQFTKMAADLSSFKNIGFAEAGKALQVGLSGEQSDTLKQLGVVLTEDAVKAYAFANKIGTLGQELTNQEKIAARSGLIMKALADANGDLEKTAGGAANQWRKFTGNATNLATAVGGALLPAINKGIGLLNEFSAWVGKAFGGSAASLQGFADKIGAVFEVVGAVFRNWGASFEVAKLVVAQGLNQILDYFEVLGPNAAKIAEYIASNWKKLLLDAFNAIVTGIGNLWGNFQKLGEAIGKFLADPTKGLKVDFTPILDGFEATAGKLPELIKPHLTDLSKEIAAAAQPILDDIQRRSDQAKKTATAVQGSAGAAAGATEGQGGIDQKLEQHMKKLAEFSKSTREAVQNPIQKAIKEVNMIEQSVNAGLLTKKEGIQAKAKALLEAGINAAPKFAGAVSRTSQEGRSAILQATAGRGDSTLKDAARRTAEGIQILIALQREQNRRDAKSGLGEKAFPF